MRRPTSHTTVHVLLTAEDIEQAVAEQLGQTDRVIIGPVQLNVVGGHDGARRGDMRRLLLRLAAGLEEADDDIVGWRCALDDLFSEPPTVLRTTECPWFYRCHDRPVTRGQVDDLSALDIRPPAFT